MGLLGGYCETEEEMAAIEQRDRAYMEAEHDSERIAELEAALLRMYLDVKFMVERGVISNVLDDVIYAEARRLLGPAADA